MPRLSSIRSSLTPSLSRGASPFKGIVKCLCSHPASVFRVSVPTVS